MNDKIYQFIENYKSIEPHLKLSIGIIIEDNQFSFGDDKLYEIGSNTKIITASIIAKMADSKMIDLNDTIDTYLDLNKKGKYPSILDLATHHGYHPLVSFEFIYNRILKRRNLSKNLYRGITEDGIIKYINKHKPSPGYYFYSDINYAILGLVIEKVYGKSYAEVFSDFVRFDLGMQNTFVGNTVIIENESFYRKKEMGHLLWNKNDAYLPAGGAVSSVDDMLKLLSATMNEQPSYLKIAAKRQKTILFNKNKMAIGLGWHMFINGSYLFHKGGTCCYRSTILYHKKKRIGVVVLTNAIGNRNFNSVKLSMLIYKTLKDSNLKNSNWDFVSSLEQGIIKAI